MNDERATIATGTTAQRARKAETTAISLSVEGVEVVLWRGIDGLVVEVVAAAGGGVVVVAAAAAVVVAEVVVVVVVV